MGLRVATCIGGIKEEDTIRALAARPAIVVATVGRLDYYIKSIPSFSNVMAKFKFLVSLCKGINIA